MYSHCTSTAVLDRVCSQTVLLRQPLVLVAAARRRWPGSLARGRTVTVTVTVTVADGEGDERRHCQEERSEWEGSRGSEKEGEGQRERMTCIW